MQSFLVNMKGKWIAAIIGPGGLGWRFGMVNQPIGNHGQGIFWCGQI